MRWVDLTDSTQRVDKRPACLYKYRTNCKQIIQLWKPNSMSITKKILALVSIAFTLVSLQAIAKGIPVTNITNQCSCKMNKENVITCSKESYPLTVTFGAADTQDDYVPTNPPTIIAPGTSGTAPITTIYMPKEPGLAWVDNGPTSGDTGMTMGLGNSPSALKMVTLFFTIPGYGNQIISAPIPANFINSDCEYSGPHSLNIKR